MLGLTRYCLVARLFAMNSSGDLQSMQEALAPVCSQPDIQLVILFGSAAKGTRHGKNDLDLAILAEEPLNLVDITNQVIALLRTSQVDVVDLRRASPLLAMEIVRGGRFLYERQAGEYVRFCSLAHRWYVDTAKLRAAQKEAIARYLEARGLA